MSALADSNRLRIVELLLAVPLTVGDIADRLGLRQPQVSKHLRLLSEAGLVEAAPAANRRFYRLRPQPLLELDAWLAPFRRDWDDKLGQLNDYLSVLRGRRSENPPGQE